MGRWVSEAERRWSMAAAAWAALVLAMVPLVRPLQRWVAANLGSATFGWAVVLAIVTTTVWLMIRFPAATRLGVAATILATATLALAWTASLWQRPEEAVHLVQYGVLAVLVQRALRERHPDLTAYPSAVLLTLFVGIVDEVIQWMVPGRFWDLRDVALNGGAAFLVQAVLWPLDHRRDRVAGCSRRGLRTLVRLVALDAVVLLLLSVATPGRVAVATEKLPWLRFLVDNPSELVEYGHRHVFPGLGEFASRFELDELRRQDASRAAKAADVLDRFHGGGRYGAFLRHWPSHRDPFIHEARVHIHSRDVHLAKARRQPEDALARREHATAALREQQILDAFFGRTLEASRARLEPRQRRWLERHADPERFYVSKAGSHLVTWASEAQVVACLVAALVALLLTHRRLRDG